MDKQNPMGEAATCKQWRHPKPRLWNLGHHGQWTCKVAKWITSCTIRNAGFSGERSCFVNPAYCNARAAVKLRGNCRGLHHGI